MNGIIDSLSGFWKDLPIVLRAPVALAAGWIGAALLRFLTLSLLKILRFDRLSEKMGITEFLRKGSVDYSPSRLVSVLVFWLIVVVSLFQIAKMLDIAVVNALSAQMLSVIPSLMAALFIVITGVVVVTFFANFVMTIARNAAIPNTGIIVKAIKYLGNILVVSLAFEQMGFGKTVISSLFQMVLGAIAFGLALAFGLGCKDMAGSAMQSFIQSLRERERGKHGTDLEG